MATPFTVGYVPYSKDLAHPGDRRRIVIWAKAHEVTLAIDQPLNSDLLILSNGANFNYWIKKSKSPVILDLVDGYLGEKPSWFRDFLRNVLRSINGKSHFLDITYTRTLKKACRNSSAVIVATPEQREDVLPYNKNVYVILDDHSELIISSQKLENGRNRSIFWEGFGFTLKHFKIISQVLDTFMQEKDYELHLLTNVTFARWGGYLGKIDSAKLIRKWFPQSFEKVNLIPWTLENVKSYASKSDFAIIPIDMNDKFAKMKPENKLLGLWALGLPVLFSDTPAYKRVAVESGLHSACINISGWEEALNSHDFLLDEQYSILAREYLLKNHSKNDLIQKWEHVIQDVLTNY